MNKYLEEQLGDDPWLREWYARRPPRKPKPKPAEPAVVAVVSEKFAEAAKANPEGVRLSVRAADDTVVVDRPRRTEVLEVLEVDAQGRPSRVARFECATGERSVLDFVEGYRQPPGAVSNYDPIKRGLEND
jgi:hypothetical protein